MPEYDFRGTIDSNGNIQGSITPRSDVDGGPFGIAGMVVMYILTLIGGVLMITNVMKESPACIVPAILGFILMLLPIVWATNSGDFFGSLLIVFYKWSDLLVGLIIVMYWIAYLSQAVSIPYLTGITIGLMYLTGLSGYKVYEKTGVGGCVIVAAVPAVVFLICSAVVEDMEIGYLALIPTISISLSLFIREIAEICEGKNDSVAKPILKMVLYTCIIASVFLFGSYVGVQKTDRLQTAKDYVSQNRFSEARAMLQDIKSEEAKELYASIRYKDIAVGEIVYNGYYMYGGARSVREDGVAFVCLDVVDGQALLISLDVIRLAEQYTAILDEEFYTSEYSFDTAQMVSTAIGEEQGKYFLLSKEQFDRYVQNDLLDDYLKSAPVSDVAKKQKKDVDEDNYKWTQPYIDIWLLNDFSKEDGSWVGSIGTVKTDTGEYGIIENYKAYAGIRLCYCVTVD